MTVRTAPSARGVGVVLPGFLDGRHDPATDALARRLHGAGFTAVSFDPRGTWSSPGHPGDVAPTVQLDDLSRLLDRCPAERIVLAGHCYGALLAALAAAGDPRVTDIVALMPTRCFIWPEAYDAQRDTWRGPGERIFLRERDGELRKFRVPHSVVDDALGHDLPAALAGLGQRILFVAGEHDELIGIGPVRRLHDECGSPDKELAVLPVQHDYRDRPEQIEIVNRCVLDWVERWRS